MNQNISLLVPLDAANASSITRYLHLKDWYSMNYFLICSGNYLPSGNNPRLLSHDTTNITCFRQTTGYKFSFNSIMKAKIEPSVVEFLDILPSRLNNLNTQAPVALWIIGIITSFFKVLFLPWTLAGTRRITGYVAASLWAWAKFPSSMIVILIFLQILFMFFLCNSLVESNTIGHKLDTKNHSTSLDSSQRLPYW